MTQYWWQYHSLRLCRSLAICYSLATQQTGNLGASAMICQLETAVRLPTASLWAHVCQVIHTRAWWTLIVNADGHIRKVASHWLETTLSGADFCKPPRLTRGTSCRQLCIKESMTSLSAPSALEIHISLIQQLQFLESVPQKCSGMCGTIYVQDIHYSIVSNSENVGLT